MIFLMNFLVSAGFSSCRIRVRHSQSSVSSKALVEKDSGKQVKALRSDNGGEFIYGEFKDFCSAEGIRGELIVPHNPHQNGVAEQKNRTIVGAAQAMLHD